MTAERARRSCRPRRSAQQVAMALGDLLADELPAGGPLPSQRKLAERLGANRQTLAAALKLLEAQRWVCRRRSGGYSVPPRSPRLSRVLGFLSFEGAERLLLRSDFVETFVGACDRASRCGYDVLTFFPTPQPLGEPARPYRSVRLRQVDGVIIHYIRRPLTAAMARLRRPIVATGSLVVPPHVSTVDCDESAMPKMAVKHLVDRGHRRIGYVGHGGPGPIRVFWIEAMRQALRDQYGLSDEWVCDLDEVSIDEVAKAWSADPPHRRPTAVVTGSEGWLCWLKFRRRGLRVPDEISMISLAGYPWGDFLVRAPSRHGFDESRLADWLAGFGWGLDLPEPPPIVRVVRPNQAVGAAAVDELIARIAQPDRPPAHTRLAPELISGTSVRAL